MHQTELPDLAAFDLSPATIDTLQALLNQCSELSPEAAWDKLVRHAFFTMQPFALQREIFTAFFPRWREEPWTAPAWQPTAEESAKTNLATLMTTLHYNDIAAFRTWSQTHRYDFWQTMVRQLGIVLKSPYRTICDVTADSEAPHWLEGATLNIVDSCFQAAPTQPAIFYYDDHQTLCTMTVAELEHHASCVAMSLLRQNFSAGDRIAIAMPMTVEAVVIYLGIVKMGGVVVSIADSFSADEMATRLQIAKAVGIFTQDVILRGQKKLPLYDKIIAAHAPKAIVLAGDHALSQPLRDGDMAWGDFLLPLPLAESYAATPDTVCNILFSSGTTGDPKAIPWTHTTPIKTASDAYLHHNIQPGEVVAWPTNLGWMMGPWLIFAALINRAAIAIFPDVARDRHFGQFVADAKVTMLGVVPTLVALWRQSGCMEGLDWQHIKAFSSTGECSNAEDMLYLMALAHYKPVIEYCGGTEIGGAYLTSTLIETNYPAVFTTTAFGLNIVLLDETGQVATEGEVAIVPPSIGLSNTLLNADHHHVYFANMPLWENTRLRRHGDHIRQLPNGYYTVLGRVDDTMNLGGIKISAVEIERAIAGIASVTETAAVAVAPAGGGPSLLVIYVTTSESLDISQLLQEMQVRINQQLNPLFKIHDVVVVDELPKTASNKIMRRRLRSV